MTTFTSCNKEPMEVPEYPLNKETVEEALKKVDFPCVISEETLDSENRTSISLRDEEGRLIAGIASEVDENEGWRFLGFTLVGYFMQGEASVYLTEEEWDDIIGLGVILYGGLTDSDKVYKDFINNFEKESLITEFEAKNDTSYIKAYEYIKNYGDIYCSIIVRETKDGIKEISTFKFYNSPVISNTNSELKALGVLNTLFTGRSADAIKREFIESEFIESYLNNYSHYYTEPCLEKVKNAGFITLIDYYAYEANANINITDIKLEEPEAVPQREKTSKSYAYTVTLECKTEDSTKEVTAEGTIDVEHMLNGWKATDFSITNAEALEREILEK